MTVGPKDYIYIYINITNLVRAKRFWFERISLEVSPTPSWRGSSDEYNNVWEIYTYIYKKEERM